MNKRVYFNFPLMEEEEYTNWINRIVTIDLLEDIVYSCECNLDHSDYYWVNMPTDFRNLKLAFYEAVKKKAANRIVELTILS